MAFRRTIFSEYFLLSRQFLLILPQICSHLCRTKAPRISENLPAKSLAKSSKSDVLGGPVLLATELRYPPIARCGVLGVVQ